jgi:hypothetical protein
MAKPYDGGSKWLLEHQGKSLLTLGGLSGVVRCKSIQSELVHNVQLPDGLLEVRLRGRKEPVLVLIEFCTYPESRTPRQLHDDAMMVVQARGVLPELLALVLCPKGDVEVPGRHQMTSDLGWTSLAGAWKVQELWKLSAEEMLALPDVGLVPWVTLMAHEGPPEPLLRRCRERIDKEGGDQSGALLAVTQTFMSLKFQKGTHQNLFDLFGGGRAMFEEFPIVQEYGDERARQKLQFAVAEVVKARFDPLSDDAHARLQGVTEEAKLLDLLHFASVCKSPEAFVERLTAETTPPPAPVSSRRKKKPGGGKL